MTGDNSVFEILQAVVIAFEGDSQFGMQDQGKGYNTVERALATGTRMCLCSHKIV